MSWLMNFRVASKSIPPSLGGNLMPHPDVGTSQKWDPRSGTPEIGPIKKAPRIGRLSTGCGNDVLTQRLAGRVSVVHHAWPVLSLTGKERDHVWKTRCSGLDRLDCDPGSGNAARGFKMRESELAYHSLQLRDGVRAAPSR